MLAATAGAAESPLVVGVAHFPPHVMASGDMPEGFDIDIWNEVSGFISADSTFKVMPFDSLLAAVREGEVDAAIAGISITHARELDMDFSVPYMDSGLRILVPVDETPALIRVLRSVSIEGVLTPISYLLAFVLLCAHVLYFAERGNPAVNDRYFPGIFEAAWCVIATITTVGYGDIAPGRWLGRLVSFLVMVIGISLFGVAIAELSSGLMIEELKGELSGPEDLRGRRVATVAGTTSTDAARLYGARVHEVAVVEEAFSELQSGNVDAVLFDAAPLLRFAQTEGRQTVTVVGPLIERQAYGIAFPEGSDLRESVNRALLRLVENGVYDAIYNRWFGGAE